ncbi:chemoreceptor glutamine deamidase CheD [Azohydromonas caseinilytica]|uniref:Probable chemoreceptor glutamine deamidase CheD n=1 Tax=Azohydromonas caseinilytica TaxID=2728836 RepID=A0A848F5V4_9BURK|nr:chemoreceptor glutamine deamidase CheD [Azohydromonas caseinilytica]NML14065.1 chemoreceptor glutamine deamidase CheD [Azohydromonas caseinilytica]
MAASPLAMSGSLQSSARLDELRSQRRKPGEASFFFYDAHFRREAVKVLPGEYFVHDQDNILIMTTLGSCIAACLWDRDRRVGGMNHFMLPDAGDGGRYGLYAMELLINELMKRGASRSALEAKVFGGGAVLGGMTTLNVGERNTRFVLDYLKTERIPVVSSDVLDVYPRKVCFEPASGRAKVKRLAPTAMGEQLLAQERAAAKAVPSDAGSIELF